MKFILTSTFEKQLKNLLDNKKEGVKNKINSAIIDFQEKMFESEYYRKQLRGYKDVHELESGGDIRIIIQIKIEQDKCYFINIGTHSSLNLTGSGKMKINPIK